MSDEAVAPPPSEKTSKTGDLSLRGEEEVGEENDLEAFGELEEERGGYLEVQEEEEEIYYDTKDFISRPYLSPECTLSPNILELDYSFGYECQKLFNLCVIDQVVLIFASGNLIHFFNTSTGKKWMRRSHSGCGIGHITKNPKEPHLAVGEKGEFPLILIYEWPSLEIVTILTRGTKTRFTFLNYSPDGELLCSQGDQPDYMLTIWNWRRHRIMLRCKAYGQTVFNSRFSLYVPGHLTSSGISHIKFWKINRTFTGLKLLGELGRFGKSEICNIIGFLALPDEKVVSGCEWGNILVWDAGLIRVEVFRRGKNYCHEAPITQFIYNNGDLITVAMDGTIKIWYYETIELADPPEEDKFIEVEPIFELEVGDYYHKAKLLVIVEADPENPENHTWFGQDGNGGIWKLDLSQTISAKPPALIFQCHAGPVAAIQCSPFSTHLASLGEDGRLFIYDYRQKTLILKKEFLAGGCSLLWLPLSLEESGTILIGGFTDGVIRLICVSLHEFLRKIPSPSEEYINLVYASKPHLKDVTVVTVNPKNSILVTGSKDCTIFCFQIKETQQFPKLIPIGFVPVPGEVTFCTWKPKKETTLLVSCSNGNFCEIELPAEPEETDPVSFLLKDIPIKTNQFVSIKSEVRRQLRLEEILAEREAIIETKRAELKQKEEETGVAADEEAIIGALREELEAEEPELPEIFIPKIPNPILFATYIGKVIWLSMGGYDAGYFYEYNFQNQGPVNYQVIIDGDDIEIPSHHYYHNHKYLVLGMNNGKVRIVKVNPSDPKDFSNYWSLSMHDNDNGTIRQICFNYNYSYMFTCGTDGNVFSYVFSPENNEFKNVNLDGVYTKGFPSEISSDIDDKKTLSLEQAKNNKEHDEKMKEANAYKRDLLDVLKGLEKKYEEVVRNNSKLPASQQLTQEELQLDQRIDKDLEETLEEEMNIVKFKLAWQAEKTRLQHEKLINHFIKPVETHYLKVYGVVKKEIFAETFRLRKLPPEFEELKKLVIIKLEEQEAKGRAQANLFAEEEIVETITRRPNPVEGLIKQILALSINYKKNIKLRRLLRKYRERKDRLESRRIEWYEMMKKKPNPEKPDPEDIAAVEHAKDTVGYYQLKTASDYKVPKDAKITTVNVYDELLKTREKIYLLKKNYNQRVLEARQKKLDMIERHQNLRETLLEIAKEIPKEKIKHPPNLPTYVEDLEFPEKKFQLTEAAIFEELPKRYKALFVVENQKKKEIKLLDREYEGLIIDKKAQKLKKVNSKLSFMKYTGVTGSKDYRELEQAGSDDNIITPWEKEMKKLRVFKRLCEQDYIISDMDEEIRLFDEEINKLKEIKYKTEIDVKFLEIYILTLHQEVLILKKFEAAEEEKENKLFEKLHEKHEVQKKMNEINSKVEGRLRDIRRYEEEIKNLVTSFHAATAENKFYDFLRRIFKKKYRPPKIKSDDSESDSESDSDSESSEEDDSKSIDSKDLGPIRLDETVCPPGCDIQLYEWTFTQRSARHTLELAILEERKFIELQRKEYELLSKKIKQIESQYLICKEDLEEFMREKQRNLNEVETVVVLNLSQIQNFKSETEIEKMSESLIISASKLSSLYKRVGELEKETQAETQKHEKNRQHLTRIKTDVNHMKEMSVKLTKDIEDAMIKKFGTKVDLDDIEEALLKRLVAEMHSEVMELGKTHEKKLQEVKSELSKKNNEFAVKLQENTERYNILAVLQEEKTKIQETIERQDKIMCRQKGGGDEAEDDMENLKKIVRMQECKINKLREEIAMLKLKTKPKLPLNPSKQEPLETIRIKTCDQGFEELNKILWEEIRDMCDETIEIAQDPEAMVNKQDQERIKTLTRQMIEKLPEKCKMGVLKHMAQGALEDNITKEKFNQILDTLIKSLEKDSILEVTQLVKDTMESVVPSSVDEK